MVANDLGDRVTPCVVAFTDQDVVIICARLQRSTLTMSNLLVLPVFPVFPVSIVFNLSLLLPVLFVLPV